MSSSFHQYYFSTLFVGVLLIHFSSEVTVNDELDFCYPGSACWGASPGRRYGEWPQICFTGSHQSPINLPFPDETLLYNGTVKFKLDMETFNEEKLYNIWNVGHTIQIQLTNSSVAHKRKVKHKKKDKVKKTNSNNTTYKFVQAHFHWGRNNREGSEHTIAGKAFALEMHMVHYSSNYASFKDAGNSSDPAVLAVIAILFEASDKNPDHPLFTTINDNFPMQYELEPNGTMTLNIYEFLPKPGSTYYRYEGSLTTPGCMEIVQWSVFSKPVQISNKDMEKFRQATDSRNETYDVVFRPVQHGNLRTIYFLQASYE